jgi:hypothetical protein
MRKSELVRRLDFLESVLSDIDNGLSVHQSFHRHRYPALTATEIQNFFALAFNQGMSVSQPLQELIRQTHFLIDREREIAIEIAPARATLNLLTLFPAVILGGALISGIINLDRQLFAPIPIAMIGLSLLLQIAGRRWSQGIITNVRT